MRHVIKWFVYAGGERIPHTSKMRGTWGYDATCSCGWDSRTGGGLRRWVADLVATHKATCGGGTGRGEARRAYLRIVRYEMENAVEVVNEALGIKATVTPTTRGFAVSLTDTDAGETLPSVKLFPSGDKALAIEYAHALAGVEVRS